ncbi:MAG: pyridoxal phosphate-dependent aminotransferase [Chitinophagaceae bacterium]
MPSISKRGQHMPASPIRKLVPFAEAAKKRGIQVYHLNIGQPDLETPPSILEAVRNSTFKILEYSHSAGNESYRQKLTQYYEGLGIHLDKDQIIVTTGGSEAILFAFLACLDPGDEVIVPEPFYANYNGFAISAGIQIVPVTCHIENGFSLPALEDLEKCITSRTRAIFICNPNNPTGYLYHRNELGNLRSICLKYQLFLFSDEAYREFCYSGTHCSALNLEGLENHVVLLDTISKRYSACGGRIGALVTRNPKVLEAVLKFAQARLSPPSFSQILGEAAVDLPIDYFEGVKEQYQERRDFTVNCLQEMEGVFCPKPEGAFYVMARLPVDDADLFCQWLLETFSFEQQTLMLAPGSGFYGTPGLGKSEVRIAYVLNLKDLKKAMICLKIALATYPGRLIV